MIRIAHLSDLHLGNRVRHAHPAFDPAEPPYRAVERMMARVLEGPGEDAEARATADAGAGSGSGSGARGAADAYDAVLIAGDVFDRRVDEGRAERLITRFLGDLSDAKIPVALITGNHDAEVGLLPKVKLPKRATLLGLDRPETLIWDALGVAVHGQSIIDPNEPRELSAGYPEPIPGLINIGMLHTSLDGSYGKRPCAPTTVEALEARGYHYWALGHVHKRRVLDDQGRIVYSGSPGSRNLEEDTPRGYMEVALGKKRISLTPINTHDYVPGAE